MIIEFEVPFPPTLNHAWRRVGNHTVLAKAQREYRQRVLREMATTAWHDDDAPLTALALPLLDRLAVALRFFPPDQRRRDLDNLPKAVLDALTHAGLWRDDEQIDCLMLSRSEASPGNPRVVVRVWRYLSPEPYLLFSEAA